MEFSIDGLVPPDVPLDIEALRADQLDREDSEVRQLRRFLAKQLRWESVGDADALTALANEMASQLPPTDLDGFFSHLVTGMTLKSPRSLLTIGFLLKDDVARIRIRIKCDNPPELAPLGKKISTRILQEFHSWTLTDMEIWEARQTTPILEGTGLAGKTFYDIARERIELSALFVIPTLFLIFGYAVSVLSYESLPDPTGEWLLGDPTWVWYSRLVGPMAAAALAALVGLIAEWRTSRVRTSDWKLDI